MGAPVAARRQHDGRAGHVGHRLARLFAAVMIALLAFVPPPPIRAAPTVDVPDRAFVRFLNAAPDAPPLDVWVDDVLVVPGTALATVTAYLPVEVGERVVRLVPAGGDADAQALVVATVDVATESFQLLVIQDYLNALGLVAYQQDTSAIDRSGYARLRLLPLAPDGDETTLTQSDGSDLFSESLSMADTAYAVVQAGSQTYELRTVRNDVESVLPVPLNLLPDVAYDLVVIGQVRDGTIQVLPLRTATERPCAETLGIGGGSQGCLRVVNASPDLPAVDVYVDAEDGSMTLLAAGLSFATVAPPLAVDEGQHQIVLVAAGGAVEEPLGTSTVVLDEGQGSLVVASGDPDRLRFTTYDDDRLPLGGDQARVTVIHQVDGIGMLDVSLDGQPAVEAILEQEQSEARLIATGDHTVGVTANPSGESLPVAPGLSVRAGHAYTVIIAGDQGSGVYALVVAAIAVPSDITVPDA